MFEYSVSDIDERYDFKVFGVSSMLNPKDNSIMFLTPKNLDEATGITKCNNCLIFVPRQSLAGYDYKEFNHCVIASDNPRLDYSRLVNSIMEKAEQGNVAKYDVINGSYISKDVQIGINVMIDPFCVIDGNVSIGNNTIIKSGVRISGPVDIGCNCIIRENSMIGSEGFGFVKDKQKDNVRFPFMGSVEIKDNVEIGVLCNIAKAVADKTIVEEGVKLDAFTFIAHDAFIGRNSLLVGAKIGGHVTIGQNVWVGFNATIKQRIIVGDSALIGSGASVVKNIPAGVIVAGNPAGLLNR